MLTRTTRSLFARQGKYTSPIYSLAFRSFGGGSSGHYPPTKKYPNGLGPLMDQSEKHDHHHDPVHTAALDHKFIQPGVNKKTLVFDGLKGTTPVTVALDNQFAHLNGFSMFHHEYVFSPYAHANRIVDEPNTHDEPFGYELGDDPFDTHGHGEMPFLMLFIGMTAFITTLSFHFRFDKRKTSEVFYHQRLTAFQIEDEIVNMRR